MRLYYYVHGCDFFFYKNRELNVTGHFSEPLAYLISNIFPQQGKNMLRLNFQFR